MIANAVAAAWLLVASPRDPSHYAGPPVQRIDRTTSKDACERERDEISRLMRPLDKPRLGMDNLACVESKGSQ